MEFINVCTVDDSLKANYIKEDLNEAGIACIVTNEHMATIMPHFNGMLGMGIQILVHRDDLDVAKAIVKKRTEQQMTVCPYCESTKIDYGWGTTHRLKRIFAIVMAFILIVPVWHIKPVYFCRSCRTEFGK